MDMMSTEIPAWLQRERAARNWSQSEVAARIGVSQGTISSWERVVSAILCKRFAG